MLLWKTLKAFKLCNFKLIGHIRIGTDMLLCVVVANVQGCSTVEAAEIHFVKNKKSQKHTYDAAHHLTQSPHHHPLPTTHIPVTS